MKLAVSQMIIQQKFESKNLVHLLFILFLCCSILKECLR